MPLIEDIGLIIGLLMVLVGLVLVGYTFFICKKVVPKVDLHLNGWNYDHDSLFAQIFRASDYFAISVQPRRAKRIGGFERFYEIDIWTRRHFVIWIGLAFFEILLLIIGKFLDYLFPLNG